MSCITRTRCGVYLAWVNPGVLDIAMDQRCLADRLRAEDDDLGLQAGRGRHGECLVLMRAMG
jgi:hypothetical protein